MSPRVRRGPSAGLLLLLAASSALAMAACGAILGIDEVETVQPDAGTASSSSGTGKGGAGGGHGGGGSTSSSSSGAGGGCGACDDGNPCTTDKCETGACTHTDLNGAPTPGVMQPAGDCHARACVGGKDSDTVDDTDVPKTPTDCDTEVCNEGTPSNPPLAQGKPCATDGGALCDAKGACVECNAPADCVKLPADDACQTRTCVANKCGQSFAASQTVIPGAQTNGDCKVIVCDGTGKQITVGAPGDVPNDNNACTKDTCNGLMPVNMSFPIGTACGMNAVCDGALMDPKCQGCLVATDCAGYVKDDCKETTCVSSVCSTSFAGNGTPTSTQTAGDCKDAVCDGSGGTKTAINNTDKPVDGLACTQDVCTAGVPSNPGTPINTPCAGGYCDGVNACVPCNQPGQCVGGSVCVNTTCVNHACGLANVADGTVTPTGQTPYDCKTVQCDGSGGTKSVPAPGDLPIAGNVCQVPACNGTMPAFTPAAPGNPCSFDGGKVCDGVTPLGKCVPCVTNAQCFAPGEGCCNNTCVNENFDPNCGGCGTNCGSVGKVCFAGVCGACVPATCNGLGFNCGPAPDGCGGLLSCGACTVPQICSGNTCQNQTCSDGVKNGTETDVDCGGGCPTQCGSGQNCLTSTDCVSGNCKSPGNTCQ